MICFRDKTYCASDCKRDTCDRHWTDELHEQARRWWNHAPDDAPVAFMDYAKQGCKDYLK